MNEPINAAEHLEQFLDDLVHNSLTPAPDELDSETATAARATVMAELAATKNVPSQALQERIWQQALVAAKKSEGEKAEPLALPPRRRARVQLDWRQVVLVGLGAAAVLAVCFVALSLVASSGSSNEPNVINAGVPTISRTQANSPAPGTPAPTFPGQTPGKNQSPVVLGSCCATELKWSPDGTMLAMTTSDGVAKVWSADGKKLLATIVGAVEPLVWSPDSSSLVTGSGVYDKTFRRWSPDGKLLATFVGHTDGVFALAWQPHGDIIASGSADRTVRLWSPDGKPIATLKGHSSEVATLKWSPDGTMLVSGGNDRTMRFWKPDGTAVAVFNNVYVFTIAWSPDSKQVAASLSGAGNGTVETWDTQGRPLIAFAGSKFGEAYKMVWSSDSQILAGITGNGKVQFWQANNGVLLDLLPDLPNAITDVAWSPDGKRLATSYYKENSLRLWGANSTNGPVNVWSGESKLVATMPGGATLPAWSPDSKVLAAGSTDTNVTDSDGRLWDADGKLLTKLVGPVQVVTDVSWSPDGVWLAAVYDDNRLRTWGPQIGYKGILLYGAKSPVVWSPGSTRFAAIVGSSVQIWDNTGKEFARPAGNTDPSQLAWSPDGKWLAIGSKDGAIWLINIDDKSERALFSHTSPVTNLVWSPDSKILASSAKGEIKLWSANGTLLASPTGHSGNIASLAWSPDGKWLASSAPNEVSLWRTDGQFVTNITAFSYPGAKPSELAWSPDGKWLAAGFTDTDTIKLWRTNGSPQEKVLPTIPGWRSGLAWSPDSKKLALGGESNSVKIWYTDKTELTTFSGHTNTVLKVAWSPNGKKLVSGAVDGTVRVWEIDD